ncbi:MAG: DUF533 domain-containing protein [Desulfobulbus sp.]|jgi:uncharacterized membrane protein YebE (DUF533 family)|nr:DUF533 domain-containing protein [Desulfobulbus sp.]
MANFTDLLGTLIKAGMSPSSVDRTTSALGGRDGLGALTDLLGQVMGGSRQSGAGAGGGLGDLLGSILGGAAGSRGGAGSGLGGVLGRVLGSLGTNRPAAGGLGALAGAILGGGRGATRGAIGGGGLALLASLAFAALQKAGRQPQIPTALMEEETPEQQQQLEAQAQTIVRAMINAAKADGQIDEAEVQKIIGRLDDNGLTEEEKNFFLVEARKPMDLQGIIAEAAASQELATEVYAASLLAIEVDTTAEQQYLQQLADGLGLPAEAVAHIHATLGVQAA